MLATQVANLVTTMPSSNFSFNLCHHLMIYYLTIKTKNVNEIKI